MTSVRALAATLLAALLVGSAGCGDDRTAIDGGTPDASSPPVDASDAATGPPGFVIATWNLYNFSTVGPSEFRTPAIAATITSLNADVIGVQELKVEDGTVGEPPQAWDALLDVLPGYEGVHNPWDTFDTTVGLLYRSDTTTLIGWQTIFDEDSYAFPRPPLHATIRIDKGGASETLDLIVVHFKAFDDSVDRRRRACELLRGYIDGRSGDSYVVIGDFNDDPYDLPHLNSFTDTFLDQEPDYHFVTMDLPAESVTSTGWYHWVGGVEIVGEFLNHAVVTGGLFSRYSTVQPEILGQPTAEFDSWARSHSDHFPVLVRFEP